MRIYECEVEKDYAISADVRGWGRYSYQKVKGTFIRLVPNTRPQAGRFRLENGETVQRSQFLMTWEQHETRVAESIAANAKLIEEANELALRIESMTAPIKEALGDAVTITHYAFNHSVTLTIDLGNLHRLVRPFCK